MIRSGGITFRGISVPQKCGQKTLLYPLRSAPHYDFWQCGAISALCDIVALSS